MNEKPNILFLIADQFRADCLSCAGNPVIKTPNLDHLAADGVRFDCAYSPDPICVPARASMITGLYPHKCTGIKNNGGAIKNGIFKLPEFFRVQGYETYASGKLHYVPYSAPGTPRLLHGFAKASLAESGRILKEYDPQNTGRGIEDYADFLSDQGWHGFTRAHGAGNNDMTPVSSPLPAEFNVDAWVANRGIEYLEEHLSRKSAKPFLLNCGFPKPHSPYDPPPPWDHMYDPRQMPLPFSSADGDGAVRNLVAEKSSAAHGLYRFSSQAIQNIRAHYYGLISFQDAQIGRIITFLKNKGLYDNTIIVFTADHGDMLGDFNYVFKSTMYEGSCRVPFIIKSPGITAGVTKALAGLQDLSPTILSLCGLKAHADFDGMDLSPVLINKQTVRDYLISYSLDDPQQTYMVRNSRFKFIYNQVMAIEELYDMQKDMHEECNLASGKNHEQMLKEIRNTMCRWARANGDFSLFNSDNSLKVSHLDRNTFQFNEKNMGWRHY
ncbi:MAG TPA: hypothetical protein DC049_00630 [Spirochaetia bacterium]|nr:hypothetical protein [Spirochaetia bacterium]